MNRASMVRSSEQGYESNGTSKLILDNSSVTFKMPLETIRELNLVTSIPQNNYKPEKNSAKNLGISR